MPVKGAERLPEKEKIVLLHEKVAKKFGSLRKTQYLCTRLQEMVPWMSGLVYGLQNRPRRFESARHLRKKKADGDFHQPFTISFNHYP